MINAGNIMLSQQELKACKHFSIKSAYNQQEVEFGESSTKPRSVREIARDNLIGKIAEVAFCKVMHENYGIDIALDFNYYPRGQWDRQDAAINNWRIDIKATRKGGQWMLIDWNKLNFRQHNDELSHIYLMFTVDWDRKTDMPTGKVSYEGAASLSKLSTSCQTTYVLRKGEYIPNTNTPLQTDNFGIHFGELYKDLSGLVTYLTYRQPPASLIANFRNPFSGHVASQFSDDISHNKSAKHYNHSSLA